MDLADVLHCLVEAEAGQRRPELCDRRYVLAGYVEDDGEDNDEDNDDEDDDEDNEGVGRVLAEATSVYDALDLLGSHLAELYDYHPDELLEDVHGEDVGERDYTQWLDEMYWEHIAQLRQIQAPNRRLLAYFLMGYLGAMDIETTDFWRDAYLGQTPVLFTGARFVLLASAAPPNQGEAYAILECQPTGTLTDQDRALVEACRLDDPDAVAAALSAGGQPNSLDQRGMSALHVAVAHRHPAVVDVLLAAGAESNLQGEFGNAAHFAALDRQGRVGPFTEQLHDEVHWRIVTALLGAGADVNAANLSGATLLDLAIATLPYPQESIRQLVAHGARSARLGGESLASRLKRLPYHDERSLQVRVNEVRYFLDTGADPNQPSALHALLDDIGYYEREVSGEILLNLVDELLRHGARDAPSAGGRTALARAEGWLESGHSNYRLTVERLREASTAPSDASG